MAAAGGGASSEGQIVLFDDVFSVTAINPEGKKFDKGACSGEPRGGAPGCDDAGEDFDDDGDDEDALGERGAAGERAKDKRPPTPSLQNPRFCASAPVRSRRRPARRGVRGARNLVVRARPPPPLSRPAGPSGCYRPTRAQ